MLLRLSIESFRLLKDVELNFSPGLNVITGETGSGKSMTFSAVRFLAGDEEESQEGTAVEMELELEEEEYVIRREIRRGRSRYYLNGMGSTAKVVKDILLRAILLQGQNDRLSFLKSHYQRDIYDTLAGTLPLRKEYQDLYDRYRKIRSRFEELSHRKKEKELRTKLLEEEIREIESIGLSAEEYERIKEYLEELSRKEKICRLAEEGVRCIDDKVLEGLSTLRKICRDIGIKTEDLEEFRERLIQLRSDLLSIIEDWDPHQLDLLNEKVYRVQRLERRYGMSYRQILSYLNDLKEELTVLSSLEEELQSLQEQLENLQEELTKKRERLAQERRRAKERVLYQINSLLADIGLTDRYLDVVLEEDEDPRFLLRGSGSTGVDFARFASGGEISRVALALFLVIPAKETYLLDEIDVGVSGHASLRLARFLKKLSKKMQLVVITHSPAVAAAGDTHFVAVREGDQVTIKEVGERRLEEIARLMGVVSPTTLKGAKELLEKVHAG
ncbi:SMC domain protein [Thermocrinis albus DSM 14484]|uniref:DNA repair protein RecN n=1 Tax=Thermocrinis albus (strain DSM 14484 / JCM 11386 / HI 11/12) TaxID=638303 RepID=D3SM54_THEAH|nr:AAA family ATPase [Thermocrinis albus]ADC89834.1 SMC domain protein [Thermocrinis albus DSM 14484]